MFPLFAIAMPVIILFCGLAVDVGLLQCKQLQMQSAADAAALAAELEWERDTTGSPYAQGKAAAAVNGFTDGVNNVSINFTNPAPRGDFNARYDVLFVTITQTVNTIFMGALNGGTATVTVGAVAMMPPCGYLLRTASNSPTYTLNITNTQSRGAQGVYSRCPLYIDDNVYLSSNMSLYQDAINDTGTASQTSLNGPNGPTPTYSSATVTDPLAGLTQPTASACNHTNYSVTTSTSTTINPGTYCGSSSTPGITFSSANITFNPGLYVVTGGLHATASNLNGSGVTLFFTKGSGSVPYGQVIFDGDSQVDLDAPTTSSGGALATILFFTDRNWVQTGTQDFQFNDGEYYGNGVWYLAGTGIQLTNGSSTTSTGYIAVVANSLFVDSSTVNLYSDFSTITTGNPFRTKAVLVQ